MRVALLVMICALLAGCAGRPAGILNPVNASAKGATIVDMLVATNRARSNEPGEVFNGERSSDMSLTSFAISIPPDADRRIGEVQWPRSLPANPARDFTTVGKTSFAGLDQAQAFVEKNLPKTRRVVIFVHGFNNRLDDAVYRFAQISHDSGAQALPVLFTWPSRGSVFAYGFDKESATFSRDAFEQTVWKVASDPSVGDVTIIGHSMGAWLTMEGLRQMAIRHGRLPASIHNVILASPDIDVDVFATQWRALQGSSAHFTIFVSRRDRALGLSRWLAGGVDRLGQIDPSTDPYYAALASKGIVVIDLSALRIGDSFNHNKFAQSPDVVRLIGTRLVAGQSLDDSVNPFGDRVGATAVGVGQVIGHAVSAPILVFKPATLQRNR